MPLRCGGLFLWLMLLASNVASAQHVQRIHVPPADWPSVRFGTQLNAQVPSGPLMPGLGAVVKEMPLDIWRFLSWDTALVLGVGGASAGIAHVWDDDLKQEVDTNPQLNSALDPGHTYGSFSFQAAVGIGMYGIGRLFESPSFVVSGADVMRAQLVSQVWVQVLKFSAQRTRPDGSDDLSFPSGHSASSFATAAVLQRHFGWKVGIPAYVVAGYVATARVHDNRHYLSDVVVGAAMGIAGERTVMRSGRYTARVLPSVGPKSASLTIIVTMS